MSKFNIKVTMRVKPGCTFETKYTFSLAYCFFFSHSGDSLTVHVTYEDIYKVLVFFIAIFVAGLCTKNLGMPSLVGEIIVGTLVSDVKIILAAT